MKKNLILLSLLMVLLSASQPMHQTTIFMIGDSTMANKPTDGDNPERGWGQVLSGFLDENVEVDNHAVNGRSSRSFINEGRWDAIMEKIQPGDYVFIQFGHNDEKPQPERHTDPGTTFDDNLRKFVNETRSKGGIPVLFNSIVRRNFGDANPTSMEAAVNQDDAFYSNPDAVKAYGTESPRAAKLVDTHGAYLESPRNVAKELDVPFVDMNSITKELVEGLGPEDSKSLFVWVKPNTIAAIPKGREDNTHLNVNGARTIAGLTIDAIAEAVPALAPHVRHYDYVVALDGSGDFLTLQKCIDRIAEGTVTTPISILVRTGAYNQAVNIPQCDLKIDEINSKGVILRIGE